MLQLLKWSINKRNLPGHLVILSKKPFLPRLFLLPKKWFLERLKLPLPLPQRQSCQTQLILHPWRYLHSLFHLGAQPAVSAPCLCWECRRANPATSILCLKLQWVYSASSWLFFFFFFGCCCLNRANGLHSSSQLHLNQRSRRYWSCFCSCWGLWRAVLVVCCRWRH